LGGGNKANGLPGEGNLGIGEFGDLEIWGFGDLGHKGQAMEKGIAKSRSRGATSS
jgi:hypothetical protein